MNKEAFYSQLYYKEELYKIDTSSLIKNQMIVVYQSETVLPDNEADLLSKILDSVGKSISGIVLKNASEMAVDCEDYVGCTFLLFGLKVTSISHFPQNTYSFENLGGNTILASDSLSDLAADTSLKMKLWNSLKSLKN